MSAGSTVAVRAEYKSPLRKLVRFFESSRDSWKQKCIALRGELKLCKNQVRAVEKSREHWRQVAKDAAKQAALLEEKLKTLE
ncbi:MAG: hypothetical protein GY768_24555 [Planctomycetaceae bacterium]|nr:hypothetical protein [Planctomycetaceae bacterium]